MRKLLVCAAMCAGLAACATPYGEMNMLMGGVKADRLGEDILRVSVQGNQYTSSDRVVDYAMRKAAEETLAAGFEWFGVVSNEDRTRTGYDVSRAPTHTTAQATGMGNMAFGSATTSGGGTTVSEYRLPGRSMIVRMGRGPRPAGAFDAADALRYLVPITS